MPAERLVSSRCLVVAATAVSRGTLRAKTSEQVQHREVHVLGIVASFTVALLRRRDERHAHD